MKVLLTGKNSKNIEELVKSLGFVVVAINPDVVISCGGDGALLASERLYPGIPKLPIRDSLICNKCSSHQDKIVLEKLLQGKLPLKEYKKLHINIDGGDLYALNDFVVRNLQQTHTIRFKMTSAASHPFGSEPQGRRPERAKRVEGSINNNLLIGDGIVVATPFGSTGYFRSITRQFFDQGGGVAFNNITKKVAPVYFKENEQVKFLLVRGKAILSFDNSPELFQIPEGTSLIFELSDKVARISQDSSLRCPDCKVIRG